MRAQKNGYTDTIINCAHTKIECARVQMRISCVQLRTCALDDVRSSPIANCRPARLRHLPQGWRDRQRRGCRVAEQADKFAGWWDKRRLQAYRVVGQADKVVGWWYSNIHRRGYMVADLIVIIK